MTHKSIVSLAVAAALLATTSLSSTAWAGGKGSQKPGVVIDSTTNRGGHVMGDAGMEEDETPTDNVLYDEGNGNEGEDINGEVSGLTETSGGDFDPVTD